MELCSHYGNFVKIRCTGIKKSGDLFFWNRSPDSLFSFMQFCFIRKIFSAIQQVLVRCCIQICKEFINRRSVDGIIHFLCRRGRILRLETMVNGNAKPRNQCNCHCWCTSFHRQKLPLLLFDDLGTVFLFLFITVNFCLTQAISPLSKQILLSVYTICMKIQVFLLWFYRVK